MNTMQKITVTVVLLWVAVLFAMSANLGTDNWLGVVVAVVASGAVGTALVVAFARGTVIARLQKGTVVLTLAMAPLTMAAPIDDGFVPGWQRRLAQYPELRGDTSGFGRMSSAMAMDAVDSLISEHLLANQPELWRNYGEHVVACARKHVVPVETVVAVMQRETAVLRQGPRNPLLDRWVEMKMQRGTAARPGLGETMEDVAREMDLAVARMKVEGYLHVLFRCLDSLVANAVWDAAGRRRTAMYAVPTDAWVPNWPARLALTCSELLVGFALVIVLGLLRRKPKKTGETDHAA